jgi:hypothetical protein
LGVRGLIFAVWWVWPRFQALTFSAELVMIVLWLITGTATWRRYCQELWNGHDQAAV